MRTHFIPVLLVGLVTLGVLGCDGASAPDEVGEADTADTGEEVPDTDASDSGGSDSEDAPTDTASQLDAVDSTASDAPTSDTYAGDSVETDFETDAVETGGDVGDTGSPQDSTHATASTDSSEPQDTVDDVDSADPTDADTQVPPVDCPDGLFPAPTGDCLTVPVCDPEERIPCGDATFNTPPLADTCSDSAPLITEPGRYKFSLEGLQQTAGHTCTLGYPGARTGTFRVCVPVRSRVTAKGGGGVPVGMDRRRRERVWRRRSRGL